MSNQTQISASRRPQKFAALPLGICLLLTSSCAVFNPHIDLSKLESRPKGEAAVTFAKAEAYANDVKAEYREALGDYAKFNKYLGIGLIPLGAATLGLGITGPSTEAVTALGLTGVTGLGLGTWLQSTAAQKAYIAGYNATNCAVDVMLPLNVTKAATGYDSLDSFKTSLNDIDGKIQAVQINMGHVRRLILTDTTGTNLIPLAKEDLETALALTKNAAVARRNAISLLREIDLAGGKLLTAVDRIAGQVDTAILNDQPDLQALSSIISGLGQSYTKFTTVPESLKSAGEMADAKKLVPTGPRAPLAAPPIPMQLVNTLAALQTSAAELDTTTRQVADFVNALVAKKPLEALASCGVDPKLLVTDIVIDPASPVQFDFGKENSQGFVIKGGTEPYYAKLVDESVKGLTVKQPESFSPSFVVKTTKDTLEGTYTVIAGDRAGHTAFLKVIVAKVNEGGDGSNETEDIKNIQMRICANQTGNIKDADSVAKIKLYEKEVMEIESPTGKLTPEVRTHISKYNEDKLKARCDKMRADSGGDANLLSDAEAALNKAPSFELDGIKFEIAIAKVSDAKDKVEVTFEPKDGKFSAGVDVDLVKEKLAQISNNIIQPTQIELKNYEKKEP